MLRRIRRRIAISLVVASLAPAIAAHAQSPATSDGAGDAHHLAVGLRGGLVPPVLVVAEVIGRPLPNLGVGAFGFAWSKQATIGGELIYEAAEPGRSTPYAQAAFLHYSDWGPSWERSEVLYLTGGYVWKWDFGLEAQLGGGVLILVSDDVAPCGGYFCFNFRLPPVLPTIDLALRYAFL